MKTAATALAAATVGALSFVCPPSVNRAEAAAGMSPFCAAGSQMPRQVCDKIKVKTKPKPARKSQHDMVRNAISNAR